MRLTKAEKSFVGHLRVARLATVDSQGILHCVPVCPLLQDGRIYFGTEVTSQKMRNLKANRQAAIVFDEYTEDWNHLRGIMVQGGTRVVKRTEFRELRKKIYEKYQQYKQVVPLSENSAAIVELAPTGKFSWGL